MSDVKLENFKGFKAEIKYEDILEEYAEKCVDILKTAQWKTHRLRKSYNDGWTAEPKKGRESSSVVVWNATNYQLTHLLENGHLITNKRNGIGWASAHPHIDPAFRQVKGGFERAMEDADIKFK